MAKKAVAKVEPKALPATASKYAGMGQETIERDDIFMPRLKLGQSMSPEVKDKVLDEGDLFNSVTGEVIVPAGSKERVIIVMHSKEYILWDDRKGDNRGILARAIRVKEGDTIRYKWDKPNTTFEVKVDGKHKVKYTTKRYVDEDNLASWGTQIPGNPESPPAAGESQNYVVAFPDRDFELIAISMSKTSLGIAKKLNTNLKFGQAAIFERIYTIGSFIDNRGENKFANFQFSNSWEPVDAKAADKMHDIYVSLASKTVVIDRSDENDEIGTPDAKSKF
jgi:hypothetical protein